MMATEYYDFWPTIRFRRLHNTIKMRASLRRRRLFPAANSASWHYQNTRARDLATYQTVFSNGSCRNLIKVIRLIPRNNINSLFLSRSSVFFFRCTASFCHWQINRKYIRELTRSREILETPLPPPSPIYILLLLLWAPDHH